MRAIAAPRCRWFASGLSYDDYRRDPKRGEDERGRIADPTKRQSTGEPVAEDDGRDIRQHHAESRADNDRVKLLEPSREADRRDLCLVADLGKEENHDRRDESAAAGERLPALLVFVRDQRPDGHRQKGQSNAPAQPFAGEKTAEQRPGDTRPGMVGQRRDEDAGYDRPWSLKTRRQHQREKLRLIADFGERDETGRDQECMHG